LKISITLFIFFISGIIYAQIDTQIRFQSNSRKYYVWNSEVNTYELKDTEFENSTIDIREIGSKSNGYVVIGMVDNGLARLHHGSITNYSQDNENEGTWQMRSKLVKAKITYNAKKNTITYLYDATKERFLRIIIFSLVQSESNKENNN